MPRVVKKPREKHWGKPHNVIETTAQRDFIREEMVLESGWFKKPRKRLEGATIWRSEYRLIIRKPRKGDTVYIHTHSAVPGCLLMAMPTVEDMRAAYILSKKYGIRTSVISRVREIGREIGRTIIKKEILKERKSW